MVDQLRTKNIAENLLINIISSQKKTKQNKKKDQVSPNWQLNKNGRATIRARVPSHV